MRRTLVGAATESRREGTCRHSEFLDPPFARRVVGEDGSLFEVAKEPALFSEFGAGGVVVCGRGVIAHLAQQGHDLAFAQSSDLLPELFPGQRIERRQAAREGLPLEFALQGKGQVDVAIHQSICR